MHRSLTLHLEYTFPARAERVFAAWINPQAIRGWFADGARVHWSDSPSVDPRPGGKLEWTVVSDDDPHEAFHFRGAYREVKAPVKLVFTWNWESLPIEGVHGPGQTLVRIDFVGEGSNTKIVFTQSGLPGEAARDAHDRGWRRCFSGIAKVVDSL